MKNRCIKSLSLLAVLLLMASLAGCGSGTSSSTDSQASKGTLTFADAGWDSIRFHNSVAAFILKHGYGYDSEVVAGSTPVTFAGHRQGDIDIYMEVWTDNIEDAYKDALTKGDIVVMSTNFDDNAQGFYVPTYVIKGDAARGIPPMAPDLKSVTDLPKYWQLFIDPGNPDKGRVYGSPPGWTVDEIMNAKMDTYGLRNTFEYFRPGSDTALSASMTRAITNGEAWVGYYWEPTWIIGKYDMTLLEEPKFDTDLWDNGYACAFAPCPVTITVNKSVPDEHPEIISFLKNYHTSSNLTSEALAYMEENQASADEAAVYFLKSHPEVWTGWVPEDVKNKVLAALK